jgi:hypothetical protein
MKASWVNPKPAVVLELTYEEAIFLREGCAGSFGTWHDLYAALNTLLVSKQ